jgi:tellurite resistance protein TerC
VAGGGDLGRAACSGTPDDQVISVPLLSSAPPVASGSPPVGSPTLWMITIGAVLVLLGLDFLLTRRPHEVSLREAAGWSAFYIALPLAFGVFVWTTYGGERGLEFMAGYLVEKSLSVDNLFLFMLLLTGFAVPQVLQQRVLLYGIVGALVLRGAFIAVGAAALQAADEVFIVFGLILLVTAVKVIRDARSGHGAATDVTQMRSVRLLQRFMPVSQRYEGPKMTTRVDGQRALTPFALVMTAVLVTDAVFAVDSIPAVYGITDDPYLVFATNAFALLGLRALYFLLQGLLSRLVHLGYGLGVILAFIGVKLLLHYAHGVWPSVPEIPTLASLAVIVAVLAITTVTSLRAGKARTVSAAGDTP